MDKIKINTNENINMTEDLVKSDSGDPSSDYLVNKCDTLVFGDNGTIEVNLIPGQPDTHKLRINSVYKSAIDIAIAICSYMDFGVTEIDGTGINDINLNITTLTNTDYRVNFNAFRLSDGQQIFPSLISRNLTKFTIKNEDSCMLHWDIMGKQ